MARVSVIIPTYNRASLLPRAIHSAQNAGNDVEVVVVDDASTDETPAVCRSIPGIRYLRLEQNANPAGARNAGLRIASAKYVALLDDDDIRLPGSFEAQLQALEANPEAAFVYGAALIADPVTGQLTGEITPTECPTADIFWRLLQSNFIASSTVIAQKHLIQEVGLFDTTVPRVEDWMMWIRLAEQHTVAAVKHPVAIYRTFTRESGQLSSNRTAVFQVSAFAQAKGLQLPRALAAPASQRRRVRHRFLDGVSGMLVSEAAHALAARNYKLAIDNYLIALRMSALQAARPYSLRTLIYEGVLNPRAADAAG